MLSAATAAAPADVEAVVHGYLSQRFPALASLDAETPLLDSGVIDSLGILELMTFLSDRFGVTLEDSDFDRDNLATPGRLVRFIVERSRH